MANDASPNRGWNSERCLDGNIEYWLPYHVNSGGIRIRYEYRNEEGKLLFNCDALNLPYARQALGEWKKRNNEPV